MPQLDVTTPDLVARAVTIDGHELTYFSGGEGPTVLVLHDDGSTAARAYAGLAEAYHVLAVDAALLPSGAGEQDTAATVRKLLKAEGKAGEGALAGIVGAGAAVELAERLAARENDLGALVLADIPEQFSPSAAIETPTLVLAGDECTGQAASAARAAATFYPSCALIFLYAAGSNLAAARPEAFADVVGDFVRHKIGFARVHKSGLINP